MLSLAALAAAGPVQGDHAQGTFAPAGPPMEPPRRVAAGGNCVIDLRQRYAASGSLSGSFEIDYRILTYGPCPAGPPAPGTYDETWVARGTFSGTFGGRPASADFTYTADVKRGGAVRGSIDLGGELSGKLTVTGNFAEGSLSYAGDVSRGEHGEARPEPGSSLEQWIRSGFEFHWESGQPMRDEVRRVWSQLGRGGVGYGFRSFQARGDTARSSSNRKPQNLLASMEYWRVTLDELHTSVVGEIGLAWGVYTEEFKLKGKPPETERVRFTNTLRWDGQGWTNLLYHRDAQSFGENGRYLVRK